MSKRILKIIAICAINPHRLIIAGAALIADFGCWLSEKIDDGSRGIGSWSDEKRQFWPVFGKKLIANFTVEENRLAKEKAAEQQRHAAKSILPKRGR